MSVMRSGNQHLYGMAAVDHIEILKGAASMSVGHSALGGVINIINKQPKAHPAFDASYTIGSYGTHRITAGGTSAISSKAKCTRRRGVFDQ